MINILASRMNEMKNQLFQDCENRLKERIKRLILAMKAQKEAANSDTKSSAGDKYETGTAMTHLELEKLGGQLEKAETDLSKLRSFEKSAPGKSIKAGDLIKTENNLFWISIGVGEVLVHNTKIFVVSPMSPIAQQLLGHSVGYEFIFNRTKDRILEIN